VAFAPVMWLDLNWMTSDKMLQGRRCPIQMRNAIKCLGTTMSKFQSTVVHLQPMQINHQRDGKCEWMEMAAVIRIIIQIVSDTMEIDL
jgi:hypothetical protein